jgi:type IV pilus assembly protein PilY1
MRRCSLLCLLLSIVALLTASRSQATPVLHLAYASGLPGSQLQLDTTGLTLRARDADGTPRWSYQVQQAIDGSDCSGEMWLTPLLQDANGDGLIDAARNERARLVLSLRWQAQGRSHSAVVALEASTPGPPQQLWRRDDQQLPALADLVTAPTAARLRIGRLNQDSAHWVVMLGAGLPRAATATSTARSGAQLLILDAQDGRTLWRGGGSGSGNTDQQFAGLQHAMVAPLTVLDTNNDGYADRLYVGDWNAALWRFDLTSGADAARLAAGGILAQLADPEHPLSRGFLAAADVTLLSRGSAQWFNIALGSIATGRAPAGTQALFVVRDHNPYTPLTQSQFDTRLALLAADLPVLGDSPSQELSASTPGWQVPLGRGQSFTRALTLGGVLLFTQVLSPPPLEVLSCRARQPRVQVAVGAVSATTGLPVIDLNRDGRSDAQDRATVVPQVDTLDASLKPAPQDSTPDAPGCLLDGVALAACPALPPPRQLYWRRDDAD